MSLLLSRPGAELGCDRDDSPRVSSGREIGACGEELSFGDCKGLCWMNFDVGLSVSTACVPCQKLLSRDLRVPPGVVTRS